MKAKVLGVQNVNFTNHDTGEVVKGVKLHCTYKDPDVNGDFCEAFFVSDRLGVPGLYDIKPGTEIDFERNRRGKVNSVAIRK